jgi:glycosyltransferase involved in cell wall biosynthesis
MRFGLGVAEAMAAGLSVITTDKGAVADFTSYDTVWQVKSKLVDCMQYPCDNGKRSVFGLPTGNMPQWLNYSTSDLGQVMRSVRDQPSLAKAKAKAAQRCVMSPSICQHFDHTASCFFA